MSEEKTEQPTDKKLEDARDKGQVPVSKDLAKVAILLAMAEVAFISRPMWMDSIHVLMKLSLAGISQQFRPAMNEMIDAAGLLLLLVFSVCFVLCVIVGVAAHWGQFGILVSTEALEPKLDKLNPVNGFKQLFSKKKLVDLLMTIGKAILIGWMVYALVRNELPAIIHLAGGEPKDIFNGFVELLSHTFHMVIGLCLFIAIIDFGMQKYFHTKELMMDMEEIKREYKESEGDPMVKNQRKQLAREWAMSGPAAETENANAVVTNPTHFAIAMFYDPVDAPVPMVIAKGKDEIAQAMIRRAKELGIPVIRHVWLARTLYATGRPDNVIPKSSYEAAAYVYAVVNQLVAMGETDREIELESRGDPPDAYN